MTWEPTARDDEVYAATPLTKSAEPTCTVPSMNVTVPVAVETVDAVKVTGFSSRIGFAEEVIVTVGVGLLTTIVMDAPAKV